MKVTNKKLIWFFYFSFLWLPEIYASQKALESKEVEIIQDLRKQGNFSNLEEIVVEGAPPYSARTDVIIYLTKQEDSCPLVVKVFRDLRHYEEEADQLQKGLVYIKLVNELQKNCHEPLPLLISYLDKTNSQGVGAILLTKATGKSINDWYKEKNISDKERANIFQNIGKQLGALEGLFFTKNNGQILIHPDSHGGNFLYDNAQKQLYWIDTAGLKTQQVDKSQLTLTTSESNNRYIFIYELAQEGIDSALWSIKNKAPTVDEAIDVRVQTSKALITLESLYKGYSEGLKSQGVSNNVMSELKKRFEEGGDLKAALETINGRLKEFSLPLVDTSAF